MMVDGWGSPLSFWQQHLTLATLIGGVYLLQNGLIIVLVVQNRRRRWAERTASLAQEINQPLAAILSNAQAAQRLLAVEEKDWGEIGEILAIVACRSSSSPGMATSRRVCGP